MIRPTPATWFELLAPNEDAIRLFEALTRAGGVEFEPARADKALDQRAASLRQRFAELKQSYCAVWPKVCAAPTPHAMTTEVLARAVARIEAWAGAAQPELNAREVLHSQLSIHQLWQRLLLAAEISVAERAALAGGQTLAAAIFTGQPINSLTPPPAVLTRPLSVAGEPGLLVIAAPARLANFGEQIAAVGGRRIAPVAALADPDPAAVDIRLQALQAELAHTEQRLAAIDAEYDIATAVAEAIQGSWCLANVTAIDTGPALCCVTGWSADAPALARTIDACGAPALVRFGPPPSGLHAPMLLHNPSWVRPYEVFSQLMGMPERNATDPSLIVAIAFPLLFGYMFGDVGQGLLLAGIGLACGKRWPIARLFIPGGVVAAGFGLLFGSVFSMHGVLPAWWVDPLAEPLVVLLVPIFGGGALLLVGLWLAATAAHWRGELSEWLRTDGAASATFAGLLIGAVNSVGFGFVVAAAALLIAATTELVLTHRLSAVASQLAEIIEKAIQLALNTLSFVRVGAFAIAHAGLSSALGMLAADAGSAAPLVISVGNLLIIALEVLVVSVQTTRLLLFEFFIRFFTGTGRAFRPAPPPPSDLQEPRHER